MEKTYTVREMREIVKQYNIEAARIMKKYQGYDIPQIYALIDIDKILPEISPYMEITTEDWPEYAKAQLKSEVESIIETLGYNLQVPPRYMYCEYIKEYKIKTDAFDDYYTIIAKYFSNIWKE